MSTYSLPRPTVTSGYLVSGVALLTAALFLWAVPEMVEPTLLGVGGALCLPVSLWLVRDGVRDAATAFLAGTLIVPAALGLIGGSAVAALLVTRRLFPVPSAELVSVSSLVVLGNAGVCLGIILTVQGLVLGRYDLLDSETLDTFTSIGVLTGGVPMVAAVVYITRAGFQSEKALTPWQGLSGGIAVVLSPGSTRLYLADLLLLVSVAAATTAIALKLLPVAELLTDTGAGESYDPRLRKALYVLAGASAVTGFVGLVLLPLELLFPVDAFRSALGPGLFDRLQGLARTGFLRFVLVGVTVLASVSAGVALVAKRTVRDEGPDRQTAYPNRIGALGAGVVVTVAGIAVAESVFRRVVDGIAGQLPEIVAIRLRETANEAALVYGEATFIVLLVTVLIATIVGFTMMIRVAIGVGYLSTDTTGYSIASAGVFVCAAFGATVDVPVWLVFGGFVASLLVWDAGRFGTVLGREVGAGVDTRRVELVHAGGTVLVGLVGAALAAGVAAQFQGDLGVGRQVSAVALLALVVGILSFVSALR
jgi:hypothetical protein